MSPKIVGVREKKDAVIYATFDVYASPDQTYLHIFKGGIGDPILSAPIGRTMENATRIETNVCDWEGSGAYMPFNDGDCIFVILSIEGVVVEGHAEPGIAEVLERIQLDLTIMQKPTWTVSMGRITVRDAVLDARIRQIEHVLSELLQLRDDATPPQWRLRQALRKLGWRPYQGIDNRRLDRPQVIPRRATFDIEVTVGPNLPIRERVRLRVMLRGIVMMDRL